MEHLGGPLSAAGTRKLVRWLHQQQSDYGTTFWFVERKSDDQFLGFCGVVRVDEDDSTVLGCLEIGWRFRNDCWGHGFAKEAAIASLHHAFTPKEAQLRIVSRTSLDNQASWGLMRRLGMKHDPRLDYVDKHGDPLIVHVLTYVDWNELDLPDNRVA